MNARSTGGVDQLRRHRGLVRSLQMLLAAFLAVTMIFASSCANDPTGGFEYLRVTLGGEPVLGVSKKGGQVRGVVVYFHGFDSDEFVLTSDGPHTELTRSLIEAGFAVVAGKAGGNAFGNPDSLRSYVEMAGLTAGHYRVENIFFLAESMGALAAVKVIAIQSTRVRGMAAINPVLDLEGVPPIWRDDVDAAYVDHPIADANPLNLPPESLQGKRFRFYVTPSDDVSLTERNVVAFQNRFGSVADISIVDCTGEHMDASCIQGGDIVNWFRQLEYRNEP